MASYLTTLFLGKPLGDSLSVLKAHSCASYLSFLASKASIQRFTCTIHGMRYLFSWSVLCLLDRIKIISAFYL